MSENCKERIVGDGWGRSRTCSRKAGPDGYCKQHSKLGDGNPFKIYKVTKYSTRPVEVIAIAETDAKYQIAGGRWTLKSSSYEDYFSSIEFAKAHIMSREESKLAGLIDQIERQRTVVEKLKARGAA